MSGRVKGVIKIMATTIRITDSVHKRAKKYKEELEEEMSAPVTWSIVWSYLLKKEGF